MIICATCGNEHEALFDEQYQQGIGCSATIYDRDGVRYLVGHYGSEVADMNRYLIRPDSSCQLGNCCDACISGMIKDGTATLIEDGVWL